MADKANELKAEKETDALKKLQAAAGFVDKSSVERLDWMYEQSFFNVADNDKAMNDPVASAIDKDTADVKALQESTAGSLFLKSSTKTTEDMLRKLREDPLFQIRRQEEAARASMMSNPLVVARLKKKEHKHAKKAEKKAKKAIKKQKKAEKKLAKAQGKLDKKKKKKSSSSSSDSSDSEEAGKKAAPSAGREEPAARAARAREGQLSPPPRRRDSPPPRGGRGAASSRSPRRGDRGGGGSRRSRSRSPRRRRGDEEALGPTNLKEKEESLGPTGNLVDKRAQFAEEISRRKDASLASRGAPRRMTDEEKLRRIQQMEADAKSHERSKDKRILAAELKDKEMEEKEMRMRMENKQEYFGKVKKDVYMGDSVGNVADRLKNQRHRRGKNLNDPLERDG